jgi:vancomycin permeability regulator SanA
MKKHIKILIIIASCLVCAGLLGASALLLANGYVKRSTADQILTPEQAAALEGVDCIVVLGCLVKADGTPSDMLYDRISVSVTLYQNGTSPKLLMSGDHGREDYDEVTVMKRFAVEAGVPEEDIFQDHAGFSTYESLWRAREIFGAERVVIVTQEYHLYRALHLAEQLGLEAVGVSADLRPYRGQILRNGREMLARVKAFADGILQPDAVGGEPISLAGDGRVTDG